MDAPAYDQRTAIHLAANEGLLEVVRVLVDELGASVSPRDRWAPSSKARPAWPRLGHSDSRSSKRL